MTEEIKKTTLEERLSEFIESWESTADNKAYFATIDFEHMINFISQERKLWEDERKGITETVILLATTEALEEPDPWKQVTKMRDILLSHLKSPEEDK